jgi:hypothetical protein
MLNSLHFQACFACSYRLYRNNTDNEAPYVPLRLLYSETCCFYQLRHIVIPAAAFAGSCNCLSCKILQEGRMHTSGKSDNTADAPLPCQLGTGQVGT